MQVEFTEKGMAYDWWLAGPEGAGFCLHPLKGNYTKEQIEEAKSELYRSRDVVYIRIEPWTEEQLSKYENPFKRSNT